MNLSSMRNFGALCTARFVDYMAFTTSTDAAEQDGAWIDRSGYESCKVIFAAEAVLTATKTLTIAANLQDASDSSGTGAADYGTAMAATQIGDAGESGGSTESGILEMDVDLSDADQYIRVQWTPTLSATSADTGAAMVIVLLGGAVSEDASATQV